MGLASTKKHFPKNVKELDEWVIMIIEPDTSGPGLACKIYKIILYYYLSQKGVMYQKEGPKDPQTYNTFLVLNS